MPSTIRGRILFLLLVVLLPILLLQAGIYYNRFQDSRAAELQSNLEVARAVAVTFEEYLQDVLHQELAIGLAFTSSLPLSPDQGNSYLAINVQEYSTVRDFEWVSAQGLALASSQPLAIGSNISGQSYFQKIATGQEWSVSDLLVEPITGEPSFIIARGIRDERGVLQGLVLAIVDPPHLGRVFRMERGGQGVFVIIDQHSRIVYQRPEVALGWEQRSVPSDALLRAGLSGQERIGTFFPGDNQSWMGAATPITSIGWVTRAGRPEAVVDAEILRDLSRDLALFVMVAVGALLIALLVSRNITVPVSQVRQYAIRVGSGEITTPIKISSPREMEDLATTLTGMAEQIHAREQLLRADVAALDRANAALRDAEQRLLIEREQERKALARELHDQVIQDLIGAKFALENLVTDGASHPDELIEVHNSVGALIDVIRRICTDLRPPTIDSLGLGPALQSYINDWSVRAGITTQVEIDADLGRLPEIVELSIFRIVQEGLSNIWKHAGASEARICLQRISPTVVRISIADNGRGIAGEMSLAALAEQGHYGLVGISERVTLLGGFFKAQNQITGGFVLEAQIPVSATVIAH